MADTIFDYTSNEKVTVDKIVAASISDNAPDYENIIKTKFPGYNFIISFPTCPNPSEKYLAFSAFIKDVTDTFNPSYDPKPVYGRMDPMPIYQRTTRTISLNLDIPAFGLNQAIENAEKLNILVRNLYPSYQKSGNVNIISSPPLVRIFFSNIIRNSVGRASLLGYFNGPVAIKHDIAAGVFSRAEGYETYAKSYTVSFGFNILHEFTPGFVGKSSNGNTLITNKLNILQKVG